ncbi:glutamyl-tRNA reductase [Thermospira aquatica]|uniref:Glutamyl-tRNA reductase n=1 Tax=Thermospira aquatica TaxID=2828656 RepID=A0AAX3BAD5_9SPIR|nr:glutamyl-tRNA reductase [Thermospira aquatica]URA09223.1 glutamyl-tRNA reductase [Thermospira aquatica]
MLGFKGMDYHFPIEERENFYYSLLRALPHYHILLKTCDRVELYYDEPGAHPPKDTLFSLIQHLFGLASGVESPLVGENYIFHQLKQAYQQAIHNKTVSKILHILFQQAFHVGKKVRQKTNISKGALSHALAAFTIVKYYFKNLQNLRVTIIGVNRINEDLLKYFHKHEVKQIYLGNRTYEKAKELALKYNAQVFSLNSLKNVLRQTDVLLTTTSAPHPIIKTSDMPENKELLIIDLAVPPDVEKEIKTRKNILYFDVHDSEKMVTQSLQTRQEEKEKALRIISEETEKFYFSLTKIKEEKGGSCGNNKGYCEEFPPLSQTGGRSFQ